MLFVQKMSNLIFCVDVLRPLRKIFKKLQIFKLQAFENFILNVSQSLNLIKCPCPLSLCICKSAERMVTAQVNEQLLGNKNSRRKMKFAVVYLCCKLKRSFLVINLYLHTHIIFVLCSFLTLSRVSAVHDAILFKSLEEKLNKAKKI